MLDSSVAQKLRELGLSIMAEQFEHQLLDSKYNSMPFEERVGLLVEPEWSTRLSKRLQRLIRAANYRDANATIANIDYLPDRKLDKTQIERLATCRYVSDHHNVILLGATGSGKTYIANALGMAASLKYMSVKYIRLSELLAELAIAQAQGTYSKVLKNYKNVQLLIIDDWMMTTLNSSQAVLLLDLVEKRYHTASIIFCSQFEAAGWFAKIDNPTIAEAIIDRIVHDSYTITIGTAKSESMRKRKGVAAAEPKGA